MTELDPFEMRLQSAVRRYLADAPVEVEAAAIARRVRAETSRRRILPAFRPFRSSPALAWVLLALLLLAALLGALFVAGSQRRPLPAVVPPLAAMTECPPGSTPDEPGAVEQERPPVGDIRMAFDRESGRIVAFTPVEAGTSSTVWTFDVCTNAWARQQPTGAGPAFDFWLYPVFDVDSGLTIAFAPDATTWAYDLQEDRWTAKGPRSLPMPTRLRAVYDPGSGLVHVQQIDRGDPAAPSQPSWSPPLWTYDVDSDTWNEVDQSGAVPSRISGEYLLLAYDASVDRIVVVDTHENRVTWQLDPRSGLWRSWNPYAPIPGTGMVGSGGEIAYDEVGQRTVFFSDGWAVAYDAAANVWDVLGTGTSSVSARLDRMGHWMVYDSINDRFVVAGGTYSTVEGSFRADDVWVLDPATGQWTELLGPSRVETYDAAIEAWIPVAGSD